MDRIFRAYGNIMAALFDASDPDRKELSATPLMHERCPRCEKVINESMDRCPECNLFIIWDKSKEWNRTYTMRATTAWNRVRQKPMCKAESEALKQMKSRVWASDTLGKLNKLRDLDEPFEMNRAMRYAASNAMRITGGSRKGAQNYFLSVALAELAPVEEIVPDIATPSKKLEDVQEWF